ncbi:MAG: hypothetical protein OFPII_33420 [Osedax symbiont Rs1]|nr:MAG: hypothetical protein OFPII_33420 [Osedax symbiont Rs1]
MQPLADKSLASVIDIKAFTFEYSEVQDRIRLSGNLYNDGQEVSFWITRRLALRLLNAAIDLIERTSPAVALAPSDHRSAMAMFEHQSAQLALSATVGLNADFIVTKEGSGAAPEPKIAANILQRLDISCKNQQYKLSFYTSSTADVVAESSIDYNQLHQIISLIHRGAKVLDWGVSDNLFLAVGASEYTLQ